MIRPRPVRVLRQGGDTCSALLHYLPRGNTLAEDEWRRRHRLLLVVLAVHLPALFAFGLWRGVGAAETAEALAVPLACLVLGRILRSRRPASLAVTAGLVYCSAALVGLSGGAIEAHFHFFIMIGFIALYQDWVPFVLDIVFTVLSHGIGSSLVPRPDVQPPRPRRPALGVVADPRRRGAGGLRRGGSSSGGPPRTSRPVRCG